MCVGTALSHKELLHLVTRNQDHLDLLALVEVPLYASRAACTEKICSLVS
jgi:hypothetical protein